MKNTLFILFTFLTSCLIIAQESFEFSTKEFLVKLDSSGKITSLFDKENKKEYCTLSQSSPLLQIRIGSNYFFPNKAKFNFTDKTIELIFDIDVNVKVKAEEKKTHLIFEIIDVLPKDKVDYIVWGPISTTIKKTVGEIIGVVRDDNFAIGIQGLNVKTLGGFPFNDEGFDMSRSRTAEAKDFGSVIQAYSIDRSRQRKINVWLDQWMNMPVEPIKGETVIGSKIAFFGCDEKEALNRIGEIEIEEGLPHPIVDGEWIKKSKEASRSYLIADYSEENIDDLLLYTKKGNFRALYHMEPWISWGHFELRKDLFPNGIAGIKKCVEKADKLNIRLGAHTLTNFINTNDPYVSPIPDARLVKTGFSKLIEDVNESSKEIFVESPEYFNNEKANWLHTVVIDNELIRYRTVTENYPYKLIDCERGAFGTTASSHKKNSLAGKLADHPYKIFFPNIELQREIAKNLAIRFIETGLSQMDFDGSEGCAATGQGDYGFEIFAKDFYDNLNGKVVLNGPSNSEHFYWHINTYCNWGEPWYEGFREGMQEYRINNQALFDRNFMPHMLGWYLLTETTSLSDIEWMLARGACYNAGFALATNLNSLRKNPDTENILDAIREWEDARLSDSFSKEIRDIMKDARSEFHLEKIINGWNLFPYHNSKDFAHQNIIRQPGEPKGSDWHFENKDKDQKIQFKLKVSGSKGTITNPTFEIDNYLTITFPIELAVGQTLLCEGNNTVRVYDDKGRQIKTVASNVDIPILIHGIHNIIFHSSLSNDSDAKINVNFRTIGDPKFIPRK